MSSRYSEWVEGTDEYEIPPDGTYYMPALHTHVVFEKRRHELYTELRVAYPCFPKVWDDVLWPIIDYTATENVQWNYRYGYGMVAKWYFPHNEAASVYMTLDGMKPCVYTDELRAVFGEINDKVLD